MTQYQKSLFSITIDTVTTQMRLIYNSKTNHITNVILFYYPKKYRNVEKIKEYHRQQYLNKSNRVKFGSKEDRINRSCIAQGINRNEWNGFTSFGKYCNLFNDKFKQSIRNQYHNKCYLCNKTEKDNGRKLSVHHVNYNKNCLCESNCEFVPLCSKCHTKTNFDRQIWEDLIMNYLYPNRYFMIN